jgi:predicted AAA+ superfamily ATPase
MYFKRLIDNYLLEWKNSVSRKPLLLRGARQVGKSTAVRELGRHFEHYLEVNLEEFPQLLTLFDKDLNPLRIAEELSVFFGKTIIPGKTLLFIDEIQISPKAISSLRYFYEKVPDLHLVAAGSLLEFALEEISGFGVGRIQFCNLYPFSFSEFLWATEDALLANAIEKAGFENPLPETLHQKALQQLKRFWLVGGMPSCVAAYVSKKSLVEVQVQMESLVQNLKADFSKYKKRIPAQRISEVYEAVVQQIGQKFVWNKVQTQANHLQIKEALKMLEMAGMVIPVTHTSGNGIPIGAESDPKKQKMMLLDTGMWLRFSGLSLSSFFLESDVDLINKGSLAEQHWALEYLKSQAPIESKSLFYWHREAKSANAEVDFLVQILDQIFPVEIKASGKGSMQSLRTFLKEKNSAFGFRFSFENFGKMEDCKIVPLYAVSQLERLSGH